MPTQFVYGVDEIYAFLAFGEGSLPIFHHGWWRCNGWRWVLVDAWFTRRLCLLGITWFIAARETRFPSVPTFPLEEPGYGPVEVTACLVTCYSMILVCVYLNSKRDKMNIAVWSFSTTVFWYCERAKMDFHFLTLSSSWSGKKSGHTWTLKSTSASVRALTSWAVCWKCTLSSAVPWTTMNCRPLKLAAFVETLAFWRRELVSFNSRLQLNL